MKRKKVWLSHDAGVSESIGFLLIFTMVIMGIGLVTLYGYPMLLQQQTSADEQIMEKNMIVLQNDIKSLAYKTVPYTETSLMIGGGSLTMYNTSNTPASGVPPSSTLDIYDHLGHPYGTPQAFVSNYHSGELRYESVSEGEDISLQDGAVVTRGLIVKGSSMIAKPRWFYDSNTQTMVINLVGLNSTDSMAVSGVGTVQMKLGELAPTNFTTYTLSPPENIYVRFTPDTIQDYSVAWSNYFTTINPTGSPPFINGGPPYWIEFQLPMTSTLVIKQFDVTVQSV